MNLVSYRLLEHWARELDGVFTLADLRVVIGDRSEAALYKRVASLVRDGILVKVKSGLYAMPDADLRVISCRIEPDAYLSTGTVLAQASIIGSIPAKRVQAVKIGRPRIYQCALGTIEHLSISAHLYFGFDVINGMRCATPEKAFLDVCYYAYRGRRFSFDPATDVNVADLDRQRIDHYLSFYDRRFVSDFMRIWGARW